jgi:multiple sugar transport system permease protein
VKSSSLHARAAFLFILQNNFAREEDMKLKLTLQRREAIWFYILISPFIIGLIVFTAGPLLSSLFYSFTKYDIVSAPEWLGVQNYANLLQDDLFWKSLQVTLAYVLLSVPLGLVFSLGLALLLNQRVPGLRVLRTAFYLPTVVSGVALATLWLWIFNADFGVLNYTIYSVFGVKGPNWLRSEQWVLPALTIISLWGIGGTMIIFLAGLQGIPTELYEAAELDGAVGVRRLFSITLPLLSPVIFFNFIISIIGAFQVFTVAQVMTQGGPNYASLMYVLYLYQNAFRDFRMGYASALAWVLFIIVLVLTIVAFRSSASWVHYEEGDL